MTPETIKAAFEGERILLRDPELANALFRIFCRLHCLGYDAAPAARPDSAGEGGKDRARELASQIVMLFVYEPSTKDDVRVGESRDSVESVLKLYGNELLEKAAKELERMDWIMTASMPAQVYAAQTVRILKSPTGATHV